MLVAAIIPARYASTRFPAKPLARETGKYLIQHVVEQVCRAKRIQRCIVATDDARIFDAVRSFDGDVLMTRTDHASGTDRLAEAVDSLPGGPDDIILNVQGDEPEIDPADLDRLALRMIENPQMPAATLACPFPAQADPRDPNNVKVVLNQRNEALYFSRALVPYPRADVAFGERVGWLLHLGVYAYRREFLLRFASWAPSALELTERLEQLRILDHGYPIAVEVVERASAGIDTPADYQAFVRRVHARGASGK